ncbi:hypothetical protein GCM10010485_34340 [Streptosporangium carneum]
MFWLTLQRLSACAGVAPIMAVAAATAATARAARRFTVIATFKVVTFLREPFETVSGETLDLSRETLGKCLCRFEPYGMGNHCH